MKKSSSIKALILVLAMAALGTGETLTVKQNDSLWKIAKRVYGKGHLWPRIHHANIDRIKNPNKIRPGMKLKIPRDKQLNIPDDYEYWKTIRGTATAYDPNSCCCGKFADGKTSIALNAWVMNGCGVDPKVIPYGTLVRIPGIGLRVADDTGAAMRRSARRGRYHVDVRMRTHRQARRWGTKNLTMVLYRRVV